ncbi:MAG TPA: glycosyltransferase family 39 protein [Candidatus Limnocylindrales bacterium]|nr:glycosyltransferase family 39 protein [Candidatus Limnocylindrales bacterium]
MELGNSYHRSVQSILYLLLLGSLVLLLATKGITHEEIVSLQGDMPRYLMNGVYFYDLLKDLPLTHAMAYTYQYYARYPALSLGHHPLLLSVAEVPFYTVLGVSVFSARWAIVFFMLGAVIAWFFLIKTLYDEKIALFSSALFATTPFIVGFSRVVLSEIPTLALILVTAYFFYRFVQTDKSKYAYAFAISFSLSVYAKHLAIFMLPIFLLYLLLTRGVRKLLAKEVILAVILTFLLLLPLIPLTLKFSQTNISWVAQKSLSSRVGLSPILYYPRALWQEQLTLPVLILSLVSLGGSLYRRDKRAILFLLWIGIFYVEITCTGAREARYSIYWIPAFCLFAATSVHLFPYRSWKILLSSLLIFTVAYQTYLAFLSQPEYAEGYESAAQYVTENRKGESILFSADIDSGYFVFFTRKHDPYRDLIVLRADKMLVTSRMDYIVEERITRRDQIYEILRNFGVGYVVMEDKPFKSSPLEWLREEVKTDKFVLRKRIPISSNRSTLQGVTLAIYEYKDYVPPVRGRILTMNIPLMGDSIKIQFDDLFHPP